jgi:hypothetical protein
MVVFMVKISIGFSTPKKFHIFPWLIKKVEGTHFSHTYVRIKSESLERDLIYQASGLKVNFDNKQNFENINEIIEEHEIEVSKETYKKILQFAIDHVGISYSLKQCIGLLWIRTMRQLGKRVPNPIRDGKNGEICTELMASLIEECLGIDLKEEPDSIGLRELYSYVKQIVT